MPRDLALWGEEVEGPGAEGPEAEGPGAEGWGDKFQTNLSGAKITETIHFGDFPGAKTRETFFVSKIRDFNLSFSEVDLGQILDNFKAAQRQILHKFKTI